MKRILKTATERIEYMKDTYLKLKTRKSQELNNTNARPTRA